VDVNCDCASNEPDTRIPLPIADVSEVAAVRLDPISTGDGAEFVTVIWTWAKLLVANIDMTASVTSPSTNLDFILFFSFEKSYNSKSLKVNQCHTGGDGTFPQVRSVSIQKRTEEFRGGRKP
jgi:hypothetical protein